MRYGVWMVCPDGAGVKMVYESLLLSDVLAYIDLRAEMGIVFILVCGTEFGE